MRRLFWFTIFLVGCGQTSTGIAPAGVSEEPKALSEVAVVEKAAQGAPVPAGILAMSGLEEAGGWFAEEWDMTNPPELSVVNLKNLGKCLQLALPGGEGDKAAAGLLVSGSYSPSGGLRIDFVNRELKPLRVAVGLFLTPARTYCESPVITLPPGYSTHTLPLNKPVWKSRSTGWKYEAVPDGLDQTVQVDLLVYESGSAVLLVPYLQPPAPHPVEKDAPRPDVTPDNGIISPKEEQRIRDKLTPEQKEEIRELITCLET